MSVGHGIIDTSTRKVITMKYEYGYKAYVADDGNFGVASVVTFDYEDLFDKYPKVWDIIDNMNDNSRFEFIVAVLDQDEETLRVYAEEHEFNLKDVLD
jgi:hypothetical protein